MDDNFRYRYNMFCINNIKNYRKYAKQKINHNYLLHCMLYEIAEKILLYNNIKCDQYNSDCPCLNCRLLSDNLKEIYKNKKEIYSLYYSKKFREELMTQNNLKKNDYIFSKKTCLKCQNKKLCIQINNFYCLCQDCFISL